MQVADEQLLRRYARGELRCRDELAHRYMPMARRLARRHHQGREMGEDLEQVAYMGLLKTIDRYEPGAGSFVAYAVNTIRGELKRHFRDHGWMVHVSRPLQERYLLVSRAVDEETASQGQSPTVRELAARTGLALDEVVEALDVAHGYCPPSLDGPVGSDAEDGARTLGDTLGHSDEGFDAVELRATIGPTLAALSERDRKIVRLRFVDDLSQTEIAGRCGISQMHVSRRLRRCLELLTSAIDAGDAPGDRQRPSGAGTGRVTGP